MNNTEGSIFRQETIPETVQNPGGLHWICRHRGAILKRMPVTCHNQLFRNRTDRTRLLISHCNSFYLGYSDVLRSVDADFGNNRCC